MSEYKKQMLTTSTKFCMWYIFARLPSYTPDVQKCLWSCGQWWWRVPISVILRV